jgi:hypothetical protein
MYPENIKRHENENENEDEDGDEDEDEDEDENENEDEDGDEDDDEDEDEIRCVCSNDCRVYRWSVVRLTANAYPRELSVRFNSCSGRSTCTASEYFPVCTRCCPRAVAVSIAVLLPKS